MHKKALLSAFHKDVMPHHDLEAEIEAMHHTTNLERRLYNEAKRLVDQCPHNIDGTVTAETIAAFEALRNYAQLATKALNVELAKKVNS